MMMTIEFQRFLFLKRTMTRPGLSLAVGLLALVGPPSGVPALNGDPYCNIPGADGDGPVGPGKSTAG